jgi:hypothetical protein
MERTPVNSSDIHAIGYDAETQTLEVEFIKGAVYQYTGVPPNEHEAIMNADSKGRYFNANIKGRYPHAKL